MRVETQALENGPIALIEKIATTHSKGGQLDMRASLILHLRGGRSWTGVPTGISYVRENRFVQLESAEKKKVVSINVDDIQAVEFDDLDSIRSFFEKPWLKDSRFIQVSRIQLLRECETVWSFLPQQKLVVDLETFAKNEETPGTIWAWIETLKSEIQSIMKTSVGADAINGIQKITVTGGTENMDLIKQDNNLIFKVPLNAKSFDRALLSKILNDNL